MARAARPAGPGLPRAARRATARGHKECRRPQRHGYQPETTPGSEPSGRFNRHGGGTILSRRLARLRGTRASESSRSRSAHRRARARRRHADLTSERATRRAPHGATRPGRAHEGVASPRPAWSAQRETRFVCRRHDHDARRPLPAPFIALRRAGSEPRTHSTAKGYARPALGPSAEPALVAQGIEHRPPEACAQVRILPRALSDLCPGTVSRPDVRLPTPA